MDTLSLVPQLSDALQRGADFVMLPLEQVAQFAHDSSGLDLSVLRFALSMYAALALAGLTRWLPLASLRHTWVALSGMLLCTFNFGIAPCQRLVLVSLACYGLIRGTSGVRALNGWRHLLSALLAFGCLTVRHLMRSGATASNIDDSALWMVATVKLYTFAYVVYDGTEALGELEGILANPACSPSAKRFAADRKSHAVTAMPSVLEFLGYMFNSATCLVGPAFEIGEYLVAQNRVELPSVSRLPTALFAVLQGVLFMVLNVVVGASFSIEEMYNQAVAAAAGQPSPLWQRVIYAHIAMMGLRLSYYAVWKLSEGAAILAGFGYRPHGESDPSVANLSVSEAKAELRPDVPDWGGAANVNPLTVEMSTSISVLLRNWNMHTQQWLERYVHRRAPRSISRWVTFGASAFWHGFYPGYYMSFGTVPLIQEVLKLMFHGSLRPALTKDGAYDAKSPEYHAYTIVKWLGTWLILDYTLAAFVLLDAQRALTVWRSWYYFGHVFAVGMIIALRLVAFIRPRGAGGKKKE